MSKIHMLDIYIAFLAYFLAFIGLSISVVMGSYINKSWRLLGFLYGSIGGMLLSFAYVDILNKVLAYSDKITMYLVLILTFIFYLFMEKSLEYNIHKNYNIKNNYDLIMLYLFIGINHIPEGFVLGAIINEDFYEGIKIGFIILIHMILKGSTVINYIDSVYRKKKLGIIFVAIMPIPISIGAFVADILTINFHMQGVIFTFAFGAVIYTAIGEVIPESRGIWNGRSSIIGVLFGILTSIVIAFY